MTKRTENICFYTTLLLIALVLVSTSWPDFKAYPMDTPEQVIAFCVQYNHGLALNPIQETACLEHMGLNLK